MVKSFLLAAFALLAVTSNAGSVCGDAAQTAPATLPSPPYSPPFAVTPAQQRLIFERFVQGFLVSGNPRQALVDHLADDYIQHNPNFLSGKEFVVNVFSGDLSSFGLVFPSNIINQVFDETRGIGMVHHYFTPAPGTQPDVVVDIFRMNGSSIQEHWDVIQTRPANATNPLAMF